ncbi:MAG: hypothetical protein WB562_16610 [Candidatus Sulfotelmatobacter sp.]
MAVLAVLLTAIYIVGGSLFFGSWWFGFLWDGGYKSLGYVALGVTVLLNSYFPLVMFIVVDLLVLAFVVFTFPRKLFAFLDRFARIILVTALGALAITSLIIYHTQGGEYAEYKHAFWPSDPTDLATSLRSQTAPPAIQAPITFFYLNKETSDALYSQLEPELEETSRKVKSESQIEGGAEIAPPSGGKVRVGVGKTDELESRYDRSKFSTERKCLEVMKYVSTTWPDNYYTDFWKWHIRTSTEDLLDALAGKTVYRPTQPLSRDPEEMKRQGAERLHESALELTARLSQIHGLVFVDGEFDKTVKGSNVVLSHSVDFIAVDAPRPKASFRVVVPAGNVRLMSQGGRTLQLRVFGNVTKPLGKDGFVDVAPVAIY